MPPVPPADIAYRDHHPRRRRAPTSAPLSLPTTRSNSPPRRSRHVAAAACRDHILGAATRTARADDACRRHMAATPYRDHYPRPADLDIARSAADHEVELAADAACTDFARLPDPRLPLATPPPASTSTPRSTTMPAGATWPTPRRAIRSTRAASMALSTAIALTSPELNLQVGKVSGERRVQVGARDGGELEYQGRAT
jgi:hypothetical protein